MFVDENDDEPTCVCNSGYDGVRCDTPKCFQDADGNTCGGHGVCFQNSCYCKMGYAPPFCTRRDCPYDCNGNGICNECESAFV